jgi:dTDP-4-dehydrorhamnose reductase
MQRSKVLVLGAEGMLGSIVASYLEARGWAVSRTQRSNRHLVPYLDATEEASCWKATLSHSEGGFVINCIGILKSEVVEDRPESVLNAIEVNARFPHRLAVAAAEVGAKLIHVSTDGVFATGRSEPYTESDCPNSGDHYGRTKCLGECHAPNVLNIRCSVIGCDPRKGKGILEWLLRLPDGSEIQGFRDEIWNGVTTIQFGEICSNLLSSGQFEEARRLSAVHHFCPNSATTKYDLLCTWAQACGRRVTVRPVDRGVGGRLLGTRYPVLNSLYQRRPQWRDLLAELARLNGKQ